MVSVYMTHAAREASLRTGSHVTGSLREMLRDGELMDQPAGITSLPQAGPAGPLPSRCVGAERGGWAWEPHQQQGSLLSPILSPLPVLASWWDQSEPGLGVPIY